VLRKQAFRLIEPAGTLGSENTSVDLHGSQFTVLFPAQSECVIRSYRYYLTWSVPMFQSSGLYGQHTLDWAGNKNGTVQGRGIDRDVYAVSQAMNTDSPQAPFVLNRLEAAPCTGDRQVMLAVSGGNDGPSLIDIAGVENVGDLCQRHVTSFARSGHCRARNG
jgi:hypothetical protein